MMPTLKKQYAETIAPALRAEWKYKNVMQIPKLEKVVLNIGIDTRQDKEKDLLQDLAAELALITGQQPILIKAKKSISNFKLREEMLIGAKVTLRATRMYEFLDRLINVALPRIRDFRGLNADGFDGRGNYNLGIKDQTIFPELNPDKVKKIKGMNITIVTTAQTDDEGRDLMKHFGMPFAK